MKIHNISPGRMEQALSEAYQRHYAHLDTRKQLIIKHAFHSNYTNWAHQTPSFEAFLGEFLAIGTQQRIAEEKRLTFPIELDALLAFIDEEVQKDGDRILKTLLDKQEQKRRLTSSLKFYSSKPATDDPEKYVNDDGQSYRLK